MTEFIIPLSDPGATDPERVGPKAANLAALARAGLPTPGGFCLTADAYRHQIAHLEIDELVAAVRRRAAATAAHAVGRDQAQALRGADRAGDPRAAARRLARAARRRAGSRGAIRSSALIEDREDANFAGQFESFLGVTDEAEFLIAVRACWAALWTSNARRYMDNHGLSPPAPRWRC